MSNSPVKFTFPQIKIRTKNLALLLGVLSITSTWAHAEISQTTQLENNIKIVDCKNDTLFESTINNSSSKTNLLISEVNTNNFEITNNNLKRKAKSSGSNSAVIEDVTKGTWVLCNKNLSYSSISLKNQKVASNRMSYLVGAGALIGGVTAASLSGGSDDDDSGREINDVSEDNSDTTNKPSNTNPGTSNNQGLDNQNQDNLLLPDDSCSKESLRSSRASETCGGAPDSLPTSAFD